jgi:hypothetical protein
MATHFDEGMGERAHDIVIEWQVSVASYANFATVAWKINKQSEGRLCDCDLHFFRVLFKLTSDCFNANSLAYKDSLGLGTFYVMSNYVWTCCKCDNADKLQKMSTFLPQTYRG